MLCWQKIKNVQIKLIHLFRLQNPAGSFQNDLPSIVIMSGISAFGSVLGGTWRNHLIRGMVSERWKTNVMDAVLSRTKFRTTRRRGRNNVERRRPSSTVTAGDCAYTHVRRTYATINSSENSSHTHINFYVFALKFSSFLSG